jgi:hypothetical protein
VPLAVFAALGLLGVVVEGSSTCPTPAAVEERLLALQPAGAGPEVARLTSEGGELRVTLVRVDGSEAGSRTITGQHSCDELADAAAVVISAWQLEAVARERLPAPPPPPPVVVAAPAPAASSPWRWELGAGAGAGWSGPDLAPAALLLASVGGERLGLTARAQVSGNRPAVLPAGSAAWRRALLAVGPRVRFGGRALTEAHTGVGLSWLSITGRGFADARHHDDFVAGLEGGLRLAWNRSGARPWLDACAAFWPSRSLVYEEPDQRSKALPRLEFLLTLGLSFAR